MWCNTADQKYSQRCYLGPTMVPVHRTLGDFSTGAPVDTSNRFLCGCTFHRCCIGGNLMASLFSFEVTSTQSLDVYQRLHLALSLIYFKVLGFNFSKNWVLSLQRAKTGPFMLRTNLLTNRKVFFGSFFQLRKIFSSSSRLRKQAII